MGLFDLLRPRRLRIAWTYTTAGVIWRAHPVPGGKIVGEERDLEQKQVRFFCINENDGSVLWDRRRFDEGWWIGIAGTNSTTLFLHRYATPELPEHKSVIAIDLGSGSKLWGDEEMQFVAAGETTLIASRGSMQGRRHAELDCRSGNVVNELGSAGLGAGVEQTKIEAIYPTVLTDSNEIRRYCDPHVIEGEVSATSHGRLLIFNYYTRSAGTGTADFRFNNTLAIADRSSGQLLFSDILMRNTPAIVPESFFVQSDTLLYVKERNILAAVHLGSPAEEPSNKDRHSVPS